MFERRRYSAVGGVGPAIGTDLSFKNKTTNRVIHQKNKLIRKKPRKLYPLLLANVAGQNAIKIQINSTNANHIALMVTPKIVVANMKNLNLLSNPLYCPTDTEAGQ